MPGLLTSLPPPPPFPENVPLCPLSVIDYQLLLQGDDAETNRLLQAATEVGFW